MLKNIGVVAWMVLMLCWLGVKQSLALQSTKRRYVAFLRTLGTIHDRMMINSHDNDLFLKPTRKYKPFIHPTTRSYHSSSLVLQSTGGDNSYDFKHKSSNETTSSSSFLTAVDRSLEHEILPLFPDQQRIITIVGVSGGCDSVGLFHALVQLAHPQLELHAVHFDHGQRGVESDKDRTFVVELCREVGVQLHTYYWGVENDDDSNHRFSQDAARRWRRSTMYELLQSLTEERGIIATAHHSDDSTETLLLKLLRGTHITNLVGMETVVETKDMPQALWARPLLGLGKKDIQDFLTCQSLTWREDLSNASNKYKRNRVRNELIPLLADIVGGENLLEKRLQNLSTQAKEVRADLTERAHEHLTQSTGTPDSSSFFLLPDSRGLSLVEREALYLWSKERMNGSTFFSYEQLQRVCTQLESYPNALQWTLQIGDGWNIVRNGASLCVTSDDPLLADAASSSEQVTIEWCIVEDVPDKNDIDDATLFISTKDTPHIDTTSFRLSVSGQASHSPFTPSWRNKPIKVKEFLRGQKVPLHVRDQIPMILSIADDKVVAVLVNGKWEVDAAFHNSGGGHDTGQSLVKLSLPKHEISPP